jgi:aminomethyltransferase
MAQRSPLHDLHAARGARFVDFGGWEMPVQYESVLAEHAATRGSCGWFDVSHLGRCHVTGSASLATLGATFSNNAETLEEGRTQYTMALNDRGGVIDDIIIWRPLDSGYLVLPNAGNHVRVMDLLRGDGVEVTDLRPETFSIAVQGPDAPRILETVVGARPRRSRVAAVEFERAELTLGGSGYTGEPGGELIGPNQSGPALVAALEAAGARPCGLGARDTLRLEAGLPLWGQDIDETTTPLEAGLAFAVSFEHEFTGRSALEAQLDDGLSKRLVAFRLEGRQIPRHGYRLRSAGGEGWVTSGNFSPTLEYGIGLGYLTDLAPERVEVEIRGAWHPVQLVDLPFYRRA